MLKNTDKAKAPFEALYRINLRQDIDEATAYESFIAILKMEDEEKRNSLMSMLLYGLMIKGVKNEEVVGLLKAALSLDNMLEQKKPKVILPKGEKVIGYAGSGKKGVKTINVSTSAAIVAASCGAYIAKACSHSTSSLTGSSDFLLGLGIDLDISMEDKINLLQQTGVSFFQIEETTPKFADLYKGRFFVPHALSFALAGLSMPIEIDVLVYGLSHPNVKLSADVLDYFGFKDALVLTTTEDGVHYIDEIGISGALSIASIKNGIVGNMVTSNISRELDFERNYTMNDIKQMNTPIENIRASVTALRGGGNKAYIDLICANAGALIYISGKAKSLKEGYEMAMDNIKKGKAIEKLFEVQEAIKRVVHPQEKLRELF